MPVTFDVQHDAALTRRVAANLRRLGDQLIPDELDRLMKEETYGIRDEASRYEAPRAPTGRPFQWVSEKQRKYVLWAIGQGIIKVPYRRTGDMSRFTVAKREGHMHWSVAMRMPYSRFVRGDQQSHQHRGRWTKWSTITRKRIAGVAARARQAIHNAIRMAGL